VPAFCRRGLRNLPAIAAVAAISAASATAAVPTATTTAAAVTATSAAVSTAAAASAATTTTALRLRPRFVHDQVSPAEILPVQRIDRTIRIFVIVHFDEREPARLPGETITDQINA
jgi:hypothetical protein